MNASLHHWTADQVQRFWDYESQFPGNYWSRINGSILLKKYSSFIKRSSKICDLGCGDGGLLEHLVPLLEASGKKVYGFDTSEESVARVNEKFSDHDCFGGCFSRLEDLLAASDGGVDLIFCCEVIEHVYDEDLLAVVSTARRLLANSPEGRFIVTTPNDEDLALNYILNPVTGTVFHRWQHVRSWSASSIASYLHQQGFEIFETLQLNTLHLSGGILKRLYRKIRYKDLPNLFVVAGVSAREA